jgi:hypothetical protein
MRYAIIENEIVINVAEAEAAFGENWVQSDTAGIGWAYSGGVFTAPPAPPEPPEVQSAYAWYLDVGSYYDRFGTSKLAMLSSADPIIKAAVLDTNPRNYIDLQRPEVAGVLAYAAGIPVPGLGTIAAPIITTELMNSILTTMPVASEQLSTVLYLKNTGQL